MCLLEVLVDTWNDQHGAAAAVADAVKAEREDVLARLYEAGGIGSDTCCLIAQLCDEELDRSGGLLGRVREKAAAIREGADDDA